MVLDLETGCRILIGGIFVGAVAIGLPHRVRADRAGGHVSARVDPGWFWLFMAVIGPAVALTCLAFLIRPQWVEFAKLNLPPWLRLFGAPIGAAGVALFAWMFRHLALNVTSTSMPRDNASLVTSGPYRFIRHPMYSAALVLGVAAALLTANAIVAVGGIAMFVLL